MNTIHPTTIIEKGAELGTNIKIGPYCLVGANVQLGDNCELKSHVIVEGQTIIGKDNLFYPYTFIGAAPQDLKYKGEPTTLIIGNGNQFREGVSIHRGTIQGKEKLRLGIIIYSWDRFMLLMIVLWEIIIF